MRILTLVFAAFNLTSIAAFADSVNLKCIGESESKSTKVAVSAVATSANHLASVKVYHEYKNANEITYKFQFIEKSNLGTMDRPNGRPGTLSFDVSSGWESQEINLELPWYQSKPKRYSTQTIKGRWIS